MSTRGTASLFRQKSLDFMAIWSTVEMEIGDGSPSRWPRQTLIEPQPTPQGGFPTPGRDSDTGFGGVGQLHIITVVKIQKPFSVGCTSKVSDLSVTL